MFTHSRKAWLFLIAMPFFFSCATYNNKLNNYYQNLYASNYTQAKQDLENNKFIKKNRNRILYLMEMGKLHHLNKEYEISNRYFNAADDLIEQSSKTFGDAIMGNIANPMLQTYKPEPFEVLMVNYYKALNYLSLNNFNSALVEAKRIGLGNDALKNSLSLNSKKYSNDPFSLSLQGLIYELNGEINNAFISYRNAVDIYLKDEAQEKYGVHLPTQLKKDLLRTAKAMGFENEYALYSKKFNLVYEQPDSLNSKELIIFFENGQAPVKTEMSFNLNNMGGGFFGFTDSWGQFQQINLNHNNQFNNSDLASIRNFRVALPTYQRNLSPQKQSTKVSVNDNNYSMELYQNFNELAPAVLNERLLQEVGKAALRQLVKLGLQKGTEAAAKSIASKKDDKDDKDKTDDEKKKAKEKAAKAEAAGEIAGFIMNMINTSTEKADTRNWQSLPAQIYYARVPIKDGENNITLTINGQQKNYNINAKNKVEFLVVQVY